MSHESHRDEYWKLIDGFIRSEILVRDFVHSYMDLWKEGRDEQYEQLTEQQRKQMLEDTYSFYAGRISGDEIGKRIDELFHITDPDFIDFVNCIFTACNQYTTDSELLATGYYYTEDQLREYIVNTVDSYKKNRC